MEYIETPYGFIGISKTGVERGISRKLKEAVKKDIAAPSDAKLQSSVKIAKKEEKVQEEKEYIAKERDELSAIEKKKGVSQIVGKSHPHLKSLKNGYALGAKLHLPQSLHL